MNPLIDLARRITARQEATNSVAAKIAYRWVLDDLAAVRATHPAPPDAATHCEVALQRQVAALTHQLDECQTAAKAQAERGKADGERIVALDLAYLVLCGERDDAEQKIVALTRRIVEMEVRLGEHEWDARTDPAWGTYLGGQHYGD